MATSLQLEHLVKTFAGSLAVSDVSLHVSAGQFCALLGASGSATTTLLRMVAGLLTPDAGEVRFAGGAVTTLPPERRFIGMVLLFPSVLAAGLLAFIISSNIFVLTFFVAQGRVDTLPTLLFAKVSSGASLDAVGAGLALLVSLPGLLFLLMGGVLGRVLSARV